MDKKQIKKRLRGITSSLEIAQKKHNTDCSFCAGKDFIISKVLDSLESFSEELQIDNEKWKALCLRESNVLKAALKRKHNKSMIAVVAGSLEEHALKNK